MKAESIRAKTPDKTGSKPSARNKSLLIGQLDGSNQHLAAGAEKKSEVGKEVMPTPTESHRLELETSNIERSASPAIKERRPSVMRFKEPNIL